MVGENGGFGTVHSTAAPRFIAGAGAVNGIHGTSPDLTDLHPDGNLKHQHHYRSVYATVLERHFGAEPKSASISLDLRRSHSKFLTPREGAWPS